MLAGAIFEKVAGRPLVAADTSFLSRFRGPRFRARDLSQQPVIAEEATFRILPILCPMTFSPVRAMTAAIISPPSVEQRP